MKISKIKTSARFCMVIAGRFANIATRKIAVMQKARIVATDAPDNTR